MAYVRNYGQLGPGETAAVIPEVPPSATMSPLLWFLIAVSAGITVWWITKKLEE